MTAARVVRHLPKEASRAVESHRTADVSSLRTETQFAAVVHRHGGRMLATARRLLGNETDAHDCVQEAFLQAYKGADRFAGRAAVGTWLHRIVINQALQRLRRRRSTGEEPLDVASAQFDAEGCRIVDRALSLRLAEAAFEAQEHRAIVRMAIMALPETHRVILILRDIEGYSTAESAAMLDLTLAAAKVRLHRARLALRTELQRKLRDAEL